VAVGLILDHLLDDSGRDREDHRRVAVHVTERGDVDVDPVVPVVAERRRPAPAGVVGDARAGGVAIEIVGDHPVAPGDPVQREAGDGKIGARAAGRRARGRGDDEREQGHQHAATLASTEHGRRPFRPRRLALSGPMFFGV